MLVVIMLYSMADKMSQHASRNGEKESEADRGRQGGGYVDTLLRAMKTSLHSGSVQGGRMSVKTYSKGMRGRCGKVGGLTK
jgi:hypothetical protein